MVSFLPPMQQGLESLEGLEAAFGQKVEELTYALWDFSASKKGPIVQKWEETMLARNALVKSWGGGPAPGAAPNPMQRQGGQQQQEAVPNWKGALDEAYAKSRRQPANFTYTTADAPGAPKPAAGPFVSQLSCEDFGAVYVGDEAESKKKAEQSAAQKAMAAEFSEAFVSIVRSGLGKPPLPAGTPPNSRLALTAGLATTMAAQKRTFPEMTGGLAAAGFPTQQQELTPKARLFEAAQLLIQRTLAKGDVVFDTQPVEGEELLVSSVTVVGYDPSRSYFGEPCISKKHAENSACAAFFNSEVASEIATLAEDHQAKKKQRNKESLELLKARTKETKEVLKAKMELLQS